MMSEIYGREEYNLIGTADDPIPGNMPRFVLLAQDPYAHLVMRFYADLLEYDAYDPVMARSVREHAERFRVWQPKKKPDLPRIRHQFPEAEG